jgi:hypothetical protein
MESDTFDVCKKGIVYVGLSKSQHNMTDGSVYLLTTMGSRIVTTQCERIEEKRLI